MAAVEEERRLCGLAMAVHNKTGLVLAAVPPAMDDADLLSSSAHLKEVW
jgi:hypothetical protein